MLTPEQEKTANDKVQGAKKLLQEAIELIKQDFEHTFESKSLSNDDGTAWLELIAVISDKIIELEKALEVDLQVANSFEKRLGGANASTKEST